MKYNIIKSKKKCRYCGIEFMPSMRNYRDRHRENRLDAPWHCSPSHYLKAVKLHPTDYSRLTPEPLKTVTCSTCNISFTDKINGNRKYCSRLCFIKANQLTNGFRSAYNQDACKFFKYLEKKMEWNGVHAEKSGEFLIERDDKKYKDRNRFAYYSVDYYEPNLNIVIEWNEPYHIWQEVHDAKRQLFIERQLGCKFINLNSIQSFSRLLNQVRSILNI